MSHTTRINETIFIHNGDYSGDVLVSNPRDQERFTPLVEATIPMEDLLGFVGEYFKDLMITGLEERLTGRRTSKGSTECHGERGTGSA